MSPVRGIPTPPLLLGAAGLIPFAGLSLAAVTGWGAELGLAPALARDALATYAAVIASFLGGIRWGLTLTRPDGERAWGDYVLSVAPSLLAWAALALADPWRVGALAVLISAWGLIDQDLPRRGLVPSWFGGLRLALSGGAGLALLVAAFSA